MARASFYEELLSLAPTEEVEKSWISDIVRGRLFMGTVQKQVASGNYGFLQFFNSSGAAVLVKAVIAGAVGAEVGIVLYASPVALSGFPPTIGPGTARNLRTDLKESLGQLRTDETAPASFNEFHELTRLFVNAQAPFQMTALPMLCILNPGMGLNTNFAPQGVGAYSITMNVVLKKLSRALPPLA